MPIGFNNGRAQGMGKVASHSYSRLLAMLIPIVPIPYLFNVVVIRSKGVIGTFKRIYARKSFNRLGTGMGTRRYLCAKK
jgi:hypothetical protein